ncbi:MAG: PolC-type DNA polymerase III [Defluviitaleaceae bacterium]|nr:PolC-type DNA polymerase III [Defluviitaleaceae bacterium]
MEKKFGNVFKNINFCEHLYASFESAIVEKLAASDEKKLLTVSLHSNEIIAQEKIISLESALTAELNGFDKVAINISYPSPKDRDKLFLEYWQEIVHHTSGDCPSYNFFLKNAIVNSNEGIVKIGLKNQSSFVVAQKGLGGNITAFMHDKFGINYKVEFYDLEKSDDDKDEIVTPPYVSNEIKKVEPNYSPPPAKKEKAVQKSGYNGKRRRKAGTTIIDSPHIIDTKLNEELFNQETVIIGGNFFELSTKETRNGNLIVSFDITDGLDSITCKFFTEKERYDTEFEPFFKSGDSISVKGLVQYDDFIKETVIMVNELASMPSETAQARMDNSDVKRVELHLHTRMSDMDATNSASDYIERAANWGHKAIAITDHGVVQAYPEAMDAAKKHGIKVIYGMEAYLIDDLGAICKYTKGQNLDSEFVVFDLETTGLNKDVDSIIEIGAVKIVKGEIVGEFSALIDPDMPLSDKIVNLTGITDNTLKGKPKIADVLGDFLDFVGESVLVAHSVTFDAGFISNWARKLYNKPLKNTLLDTVELSRALYPELKSHKLNLVAGHLGIPLKNHHRAVDDAKACAGILLKSFERLQKDNIYTLDEINAAGSGVIDKGKLKSRHAIILAKSNEGLRNLYELVSKTHIEYFYRRPRMPKSEYIKHSTGLIIGTACEAGELYQAVLEGAPREHIESLANFYDYFEIQPVDNNAFLVREGAVESREAIMELNRQIVGLGKEFNKPVIAACDTHFLNPEDEIYRRVIMAGGGYSDADLQAPLYFRTTEEMLAECAYLGEDTAYEVVVHNTNLIADMCDDIKPIPDGTFPPVIEGSEIQLKDLCENRAKEIYGDNLPVTVKNRLDRELGSIIKNGFAVMYVIAEKLVSKSASDGYLVGSRGSIGSSFAATMSGITEVNPLPPHYVCLSCKYSDFDSGDVLDYIKMNPGNSGCDMPDKNCPDCGIKLHKDGHDIPFETFLGFDGDKEPDIDLNFSGEYQLKAHEYAEVLLGKGYLFKAGTISTLADKTAFGYVKNYMEERGKKVRSAELNRIKKGVTGVKKTTGQHPGGLMVVPKGRSIYEFCPIQRPANDMKSTVTTTHFDYRSISGRLLKLDLLGHDVPTIIRYLHDNTGVDPAVVDLSDKEVIKLFSSCEPLGVTAVEIDCKTGSLGLPEFGTGFVRQMLLDTIPSSFSDLARISGLSHGEDVWLNNAQNLVKDGVCTLSNVISTRDDIMIYLMSKGLPGLTAFKIAEDVRKGKGLKPEYEELMKEHSVPDWYIESCKRIKYMFPKAHGVAYVMMTVRIGYFKLHHPISFYGASFSVKYDDFDYEIMCRGADRARQEMNRIKALGNDASAKEKSTFGMLELVNEMYCRGLTFVPLDLYKAHTTKFIVTENGLMPPLCAVQGLGETVANNIVAAREKGEFLTVDDFRKRTKATKTVIELLKKTGILAGLLETNQLTLF